MIDPNNAQRGENAYWIEKLQAYTVAPGVAVLDLDLGV